MPYITMTLSDLLLIRASWMAFNTWPFRDEPSWSQKISVVTRASDREHDPSSWSVWLQSMTIQPVSQAVRRPEESQFQYVHLDFVDDAHPNGLRVLLDTGLFIVAQCLPNHQLIKIRAGSSTSELPYDAIQKMHEVLGQRKDKVRLPSVQDIERETYAVGEWVRSQKTQVKFVFQGYYGEASKVVVYGPAEPFVYLDPVLPSGVKGETQPSPEGLIFPMLSRDTVGSLGLVSRIVSPYENYSLKDLAELFSKHVRLLIRSPERPALR